MCFHVDSGAGRGFYPRRRALATPWDHQRVGVVSGIVGRALSSRIGERWARGAWAALLACGVAGCAPTQTISLALEPTPVEVYVDGRRLAGGAPESVELRADRSHIVMIKRQGYRSQQVALRSTRTEDGYRLLPGRVNVALRPATGRGRNVEIEVDDEGAGAEPGAADASSEER